MISYMAEAQIIWKVWETIQTKKGKETQENRQRDKQSSCQEMSKNIRVCLSECMYIWGVGESEAEEKKRYVRSCN